MAEPPEDAVHWAARAAGPGARVVATRGLRDGGSPWLLSFAGPAAIESAVLRLGSADRTRVRERFATETAALTLAEAHELATPRVLAADLTGVETGALALLTTVLPGRSRIPVALSPERMRALGRAAARVHAVKTGPLPGLPHRTRTLEAAGRPFTPGRTTDDAAGLLAEAEHRISELPAPRGEFCLVHGDLWQGNTMWSGDTCTGVIDWDYAGAGLPGIDLGSLRCDAATLAGQTAADQILEGWQEVTSAPPADQPYWDVVAALSMPADWADWLPVIHGQGRTDLDAHTLNTRRDTFLRTALTHLG